MQLPVLKQIKILTKILLKYANFVNKFSFNLSKELPENTGINEHAIELKSSK